MLIRGAANLTAQLSQPRPNGFDYFRILQFVTFGLVSAPINTYWQRYLERIFPTRKQRHHIVDKSRDSRATLEASASSISWLNVIAKVLLDQTIGLTVLNVIFLIIMNVEYLSKSDALLSIIEERIGPILQAGWKIWPIVALTNFVFVPVEQRVLLISCMSFGWTIFLSFLERR